MMDLEVGTIFGWSDEQRPMLTIRSSEPGVVRDGYFLSQPRPRRWWYLVSWFHICQALWRMPYSPGVRPSVVKLDTPSDRV